MREIIKLGLVLLIITSVAAVILAVSNNATSGVIAEVEAKANEAARKEVLPQAQSFKPVSEDEMNSIITENDKILEVYAGYSDADLPIGYAIKTATPGYGGDVAVITGVSIDGEITGIKVVSHQETPGLGANATKPEFQNQYNGKKADENVVVVKVSPTEDNEIQALAGATISSKAVTDGVNNAIELFREKLGQ